jgi:hypothetical protein
MATGRSAEAWSHIVQRHFAQHHLAAVGRCGDQPGFGLAPEGVTGARARRWHLGQRDLPAGDGCRPYAALGEAGFGFRRARVSVGRQGKLAASVVLSS